MNDIKDVSSVKGLGEFGNVTVALRDLLFGHDGGEVLLFNVMLSCSTCNRMTVEKFTHLSYGTDALPSEGKPLLSSILAWNLNVQLYHCCGRPMTISNIHHPSFLLVELHCFKNVKVSQVLESVLGGRRYECCAVAYSYCSHFTAHIRRGSNWYYYDGMKGHARELSSGESSLPDQLSLPVQVLLYVPSLAVGQQ
jgi:hypothetical protein